MKEYNVVLGVDLDSLIIHVNKAIKDGWKLQGGVSNCTDNSQEVMQAVIRDKVEESDDKK